MTTTLVSSVAQLYTALSTSQGGDVIELAPGTYDKIGLWSGSGFDINFDGPVTIRSADPDNPAVVSELAVNEASNLTFDGIHFDYEAAPGTSSTNRPFEVKNSDNITIKNSVFDGDLAEGVDARSDGFGTGVGLSLRKNSNVVIENNEFFDFHKGIGVGETTDLVFRDNDIHSIRVDGLTLVKTIGAVIEGNHIHDFKRNLEAGDHSDMIQMWTTNTDFPSSDIVIRNNHLDIGDGDHTQGIFLGNEAVRFLPEDQQASMFYQNFTIEDNLLINAHSNGIVVGQVNGLTLSGNVLLHADGETPRDAGHLEPPRIRLNEDSTNVVVTDNVAYSELHDFGNSDWVVSNNTVAQSLNAENDGYYTSAEDFLAEHVPTEAEVVVVPSLSLTTSVEAEKTASDGSNADGDVELINLAPGFDKGAEAIDETPVRQDFSEGYSANFENLAANGTTKGDTEFNADDNAFVFNDDKGAVLLGKLNEYRDTEQIMVDMKFMVDDIEGIAQLFNNHMRLAAAIDEDGIILRVATEDEGYKRYEINDLDMSAGGERHLTLVLDREEDHLQVILDGEVILEDAETNFASREGQHNWGWTLGNIWHDSLDGSISEFNLSDEAQFIPNTSPVEIA